MYFEGETSIWTPHQAFYIQSMLFNTSFALQAFAEAAIYIRAISQGELDPGEAKDDLLDRLHGGINHSGAVARYFFPSRDSPYKATGAQKEIHKKRAEYLRKIFNVDATSPLENRGLRNAIEHFDERLDLYLENGLTGNIFPSLILDEPRETDVPHHIFRAFYLTEGIFQILGERFRVQPIVDEMRRVHDMLLEFDQSGGVFRQVP